MILTLSLLPESVKLFVFKSIVASVDRHNERYHFIKNQKAVKIIDGITSSTYSPLRQYWFMFAPSPPRNIGYIAFEYVKDGSVIENINIYGDDILNKQFVYYHPFHMSILVHYSSVDKGAFPEESQFVLTRLFDYEIKKDIKANPERLIEDYELVIYKQSYENFVEEGKYDFERIVLASYE